MSKTIYTMKDWEAAGSFDAEPGQEIEAEVYEQMLNCIPPKSIPSETAHKALEVYRIPVHAGFLMGEPHSTGKDGLTLYLAFGMNDYGSGTRKDPHYYYLGLSPAIQPIADGYYYFFDCMNAFLNKLFTEIGPRMKERNGGYTRILKLGFRQGDAADTVIFELVDYKLPDSSAEEEKAAKKSAKKAEKADA